MAKKEGEWAFPVEMRPRQEEWRFDLQPALDSVVGLRAEIPEDAFTAQILGTERAGSGVVIREDGLVLTIGYLITEASTIWLTTNKGTVGKLLGIGSLLVQEKIDAGTIQGNMIVPIDILGPILDDMVKLGRPNRPPRPWLGMYATEAGARLVVAGLAPGGPAEKAGLQVGDALLEVAGGQPASR